MALYFTSLEAMKSLVINKQNQTLGPVQALLLGGVSRTISGTLLMPFSVIKTRFEVFEFVFEINSDYFDYSFPSNVFSRADLSIIRVCSMPFL